MTSALVVVALLLSTAAAGRRAVAAQRATAAVRRTGGLAPGRATDLPAPPAWVAGRLASADLPVPADQAWTAWLGTLVVGPLTGAVLGGPGLAVVVAVVAIGAPLLALATLGGRADRRLEAALPEALESVARSLRSGASLRLALAESAGGATGRLGDDLARVVAASSAGAPLVETLDDWGVRRPVPGVRLAVAALALGAETGGAQAGAVDGVAETLRSRLAVAAEVRALSSQARLSALVIAAAPVAFALLATGTDGRTAGFLFRTPAGLACLAGGLALDAVAAVWMHRLTRPRP